MRYSVRFGAVVVAALVFTGGAAAAADPAPRAAVLRLFDDGFVAGALEGITAQGHLTWRSPLFTAALEFDPVLVDQIQWPLPAEPPKPVGEYCIELNGGDVLYGQLSGFDEGRLELDSAAFGHVEIERSRIRRIFRWRGSNDLIYRGPNGLSDWREATPPLAWHEDQGQVYTTEELRDASDHRILAWHEDQGQVYTEKAGAVLQRFFELPAQALFEFEISWKKKPDFVFAMGAFDFGKTVQEALLFEVWGDDLVANRETDTDAAFASVQKLDQGPGRARMQVYLDQLHGRYFIYSESGTQLADLRVAPTMPRVLTGVRLANKKGDVRLESLRIRRWSGEPPSGVDARRSFVRRMNGSIDAAQLARFDAKSQQFVLRGPAGEVRVAAGDVAELFFPSQAAASPRPACVVYQDGSQVGGEIVRIDRDRLVMKSPGVKPVLDLPRAGLHSLRFTPQPAPPAVATTPILELEGVRLRGQLADAQEQPAASCLAWQPLGSRTASPLRHGVAGRIVFREPGPAQPVNRTSAPRRQAGFVGALVQVFEGDPARPISKPGRKQLHLRTGDTFPCDVQTIDERGVTFSTPLSDTTFVAHDKVKAVELTTAPTGPIRLSKVKRERLLTLPRMQQGSPPTHLVRSINGDMLRGRVLALDAKNLQVELHLEPTDIPRDRVARIIWLHADELAPNPAPDEAARDNAATRVQAVRGDGTRLTFHPRQVTAAVLSGDSDVLGQCRVALKEMDELLIGSAIDLAAARLALQQWKLQNAPEPRFVQANDTGALDGGTSSPLIGQPAPDFELELLDGEKFRLSQAKGKVVVLDFWATWCGPCLQSLPQVVQTAREFADDNVVLVGVNLQEESKPIAAMLERLKLDLTVALDRDGTAAAKYAVTAIPQTVVIDREGKVARLFVGGGPHVADELKAALRSATAPPLKTEN